jgi:hypothetical protein
MRRQPGRAGRLLKASVWAIGQAGRTLAGLRGSPVSSGGMSRVSSSYAAYVGASTHSHLRRGGRQRGDVSSSCTSHPTQ